MVLRQGIYFVIKRRKIDERSIAITAKESGEFQRRFYPGAQGDDKRDPKRKDDYVAYSFNEINEI